MIDTLKSYSNNKLPGNDDLTKEFYNTFWSELKKPFVNSVSQTKISKKHLTRQGFLNLIEKKNKDKGFIIKHRL